MTNTEYQIALKEIQMRAADNVTPDMEVAHALVHLMANYSGRFIRCSVSNIIYYLDSSSGSLVWVDSGSTEWITILNQLDTLLSDKTIRIICSRARGMSLSADIHRISWYDNVSNCIHVYSQGAAVYKVSRTGITSVVNGSDDVFFIKENGAKPFALETLTRPGKNFSQFLQQIVTPASGVLEPDQSVYLTSMWFFCQFLNPLVGSLPALMLVGSSDSNKTLLLRLFNLLMTGNLDAIVRCNGDRRIFDHAITMRGFIGFDDMKAWPAWFDERLESIINHELITLPGKCIELRKADCRLALTARELPKEILVKICRLLPIELQPAKNRQVEHKVIAETTASRNAIMTDVLHQLQNILISIDEPNGPDYTGQYPLTDFANIAVRVARKSHPNSDQFVHNALNRLSNINSHSIASSSGQNVLDLMKLWVPENSGKTCTPPELCSELDKFAKEHGLIFEIHTSKFGHTLNRLGTQLHKFFRYSKEANRANYQYYTFWPKE